MFLYIISVYASLLGPVAAIGGIATGVLWGARQYKFAVVATIVSAIVLGFFSAGYNPDAETSFHVYYISSHLCALALWALFAGVMVRIIPEELPSVRRSQLKDRMRLNRQDDDAAARRRVF